MKRPVPDWRCPACERTFMRRRDLLAHAHECLGKPAAPMKPRPEGASKGFVDG